MSATFDDKVECAACHRLRDLTTIITWTEVLSGEIILTQHFCDWECLVAFIDKEMRY